MGADEALRAALLARGFVTQAELDAAVGAAVYKREGGDHDAAKDVSEEDKRKASRKGT